MAKIAFFTKFDRPENPVLDFTDSPHLAHEEFEPECNINNILAKFKVTGVLVDPSVRSLRQPLFLDCTSVPDLQQYHSMLNNCVEAFSGLPDAVQEAFKWDPTAAMHWLSKASDRQVLDLWKSLGLSTDGTPLPPNSPAKPASEPPGEHSTGQDDDKAGA